MDRELGQQVGGLIEVRYADGDVEAWSLDASLLKMAAENAARSQTESAKSAEQSKQRPTFLFRGLRACPVWPHEMFRTTVSMLEAAAPEIRREVLRSLESVDGSDAGEDADDVGANLPEPVWQPQDEGLHEGTWQKLEFWAGGQWVAPTCAALPRTAAVLAALPDAMFGAPGRAALSLMLPGICVRPHCGPTNHRLRLHLPLLLPQGATSASGLCVAGQPLPWIRDRCFIFDDSFEHEVCLPPVDEPLPLTELARVVLLIDLWHPDAEAAGLRLQSGSRKRAKPDAISPEEPIAIRLKAIAPQA